MSRNRSQEGRLRVERSGRLYFPSSPTTSLILAVALAVALGTEAPAAAQCIPPPSDLVSWWRANGNALDYWGGNHGQLLNGATAGGSGKVGFAFTFDGISQYAQVPYDSSLVPTDAITVCAWILPATVPPTHNPHGLEWVNWWDVVSTNIPGSDFAYIMRYYDDGVVKFIVHAAGGVQVAASPAGSVVPGTFTHVAGTYSSSAGEICVYINGVPTCSAAASGALNPTVNPLTLGADLYNVSYWNGLIDEVAIFNRDLAPTEVQDIYNAGGSGMCLVGHYPYNVYVDLNATGANDGTSWVDAYNDLQDGMAAARANPLTGEIWVAQGTYAPDRGVSQTAGDRHATFQLIDGVSIYGGFPSGGGDGTFQARDPNAYETILSGDLADDDDPNLPLDARDIGDNSHHVVSAHWNDQTAVLDGFTIERGNATEVNNNTGGGVFINNHGDPPAGSGPDYGPTLVNCTIRENTSNGGPAIYSFHSNVRLTDCAIRGNRGGMSAGSFEILTNCTFEGNYGQTYGSALMVRYQPTLIGCVYRNNSALRGGALYISSGFPKLIDCQFIQNSVGWEGGAIYVIDHGTGVDMTNCYFECNQAVLNGGAIYVFNSLTSGIRLNGCTLIGNSTASNGGGMSFMSGSSGTLTNCTFVRNSASNEKGGGLFSPTSPVTVTNSIFWGNSDAGGMDESAQIHQDRGNVIVTYSLVQGCTTLCADPNDSNTGANPMFVNLPADVCPATDVDLGLQAGSPAIDAGSNSALPPDSLDLDGDGDTTEPIPFDADGNERIVDGDRDGSAVVDIGAYENQGNEPPEITDPGNQTSAEGDTVSLQIEASDPDDDTLSYGATGLPPGLSIDPDTGLISGSLDYDSAGSYTVTVSVSDGDLSADVTFEWTVTNTNRAPAATNPGAQANAEGDTVSLQIEASDPDDDTLSYGATGLPPGLSIDPDTGLISGSLNDGSAGTHTVTVTVSDGDLSDDVTFPWTVEAANVAPTVEIGGDASIDEGDCFDRLGSFVDPDDGDTWAATVDYGDGSGVQPLDLEPDKTFALSYPYADNGVYTVTVTVTDNEGGEGTDSLTVTVSNVAPTVGEITAPIEPIELGIPINASADFADPGILDTHTAVWDWGDNILPGTVTEVDGSGSVSDGYTYTVPGVYTIVLTVTDKDGGSAESVFRYVVVYDPDGGFVTGGGWIHSPEGAYGPDPSLAGRASFGFVSKYKKGADVPTGQTEFQFKVADLNFHSTTYQWLVVAGPKAMYKGSGMINHGGDYGFMLTAIDGRIQGGGGIDKFRIRIWDKTTGDIVYDNQMGDADDADATTELEGGRITIHKSK